MLKEWTKKKWKEINNKEKIYNWICRALSIWHFNNYSSEFIEIERNNMFSRSFFRSSLIKCAAMSRLAVFNSCVAKSSRDLQRVLQWMLFAMLFSRAGLYKCSFSKSKYHLAFPLPPRPSSAKSRRWLCCSFFVWMQMVEVQVVD